MPEQCAVPMVSDPAMFTHCAQQLGLHPSYAFHDIYELDSLNSKEGDSLMPEPLKAVIWLSSQPVTESQSEPVVTDGDLPYWFKQTVKNSCGYHAILHALANNPKLLNDKPAISKICQSHKAASETDVAKFVLELAAEQNPGTEPDANEDLDLHYVAFIIYNGKLWELDGRKAGPICLGPASNPQEQDLRCQETLLRKLQWYIKKAQSADQNQMSFSIMGLSSILD